MRNLVNFIASNGKLVNLHFDVLLLSITYKVSENAEELSLITLKSDPNFLAKLTFCLKNGMGNLVNLNASNGKSENLHFDGLLLSKVCNVGAKKIQASCDVGNDLWFQK